MFDRLTDTFQGLYKKLAGQSELSEKNVKDAIGEVRGALLEADVHVDVVNSFCDRVVKESLGHEVTKGLNPAQEIVGVVHRELVRLLGGTAEDAEAGPAATLPPPIMRMSPGPTVIMMCGLQGSGKTTTCGKLASYLKKRGRSVMLAAADLQRPAAVEQLETVAKQVQAEMSGGAQVSFYAEPEKVAEYGKAVGVAVDVCRRALAAAREKGIDTLILDTAGRLHVNDALMGELAQVNRAVSPHHIFLVVDSMTGQDALASAKAFHSRLEVDGLILTKFDSDTRGGAALSARSVTGATIKFVGVGEKLDALEEFHAVRAAGRILGMGDVVSLVEKAQQEVSEEEAQELNKKLAKGQMGFDDFLKQLKALRRMGPMRQILGMLPGVGSALKDFNLDEKHLDRVEAMISSMTQREKNDAELIDMSRRKRIARGSGVGVEEVTQLVKQFSAVNKMSKQMASMSAMDKIRAVKEMGGTGGIGSMFPGMSMPGMPKLKGSSAGGGGGKSRFKKRK
ncbi:MAG: signal recognition particle protein [Phycisphaerales bacterium]